MPITKNNTRMLEGSIDAADLSGTIGASQLDDTLDLSSKTVTLPAASVTAHASSSTISGATIQTQYTQFTGTSTTSLLAVTDTALSDLTVSITPTSATSKILIQAHVSYEGENLDYTKIWMFFRDSTALKAPAASARRCGISLGQTVYSDADSASTPSSTVYQYFDSPNTTSAITYKVGLNCGTAGLLYLNRSVDDTDNESFERGISYISVTEIAG